MVVTIVADLDVLRTDGGDHFRVPLSIKDGAAIAEAAFDLVQIQLLGQECGAVHLLLGIVGQAVRQEVLEANFIFVHF